MDGNGSHGTLNLCHIQFARHDPTSVSALLLLYRGHSLTNWGPAAPLSAKRKSGHKRAVRWWVARDALCDSSFAIGLPIPWYIALVALLQNRILPAPLRRNGTIRRGLGIHGDRRWG